MGYTTRVTGEITIDPPLRWGRVKETGFRDAACDVGGYGPVDRSRGVMLRVETREEETDDGVLTVREATAIVPAWGDAYKAYTVEADLQELVAWIGDGHALGGTLEGVGEESDDQWQLSVTPEGRVTRDRAVLVWPGDLLRLAGDLPAGDAPDVARVLEARLFEGRRR